MACYLGETELSGDTVAFTHVLDTPWDSQDGQSPLMELCRMVQDRWTALHQGTVTFLVVGANPVDTALGAIDYAALSDRNPPRDFYRVLDHCHDTLIAMLNPETMFAFGGVVNTSGYRWRYNNAATVKATYEAAIDGLDFELQEDWKPIILAIRAALESLSGAEVESQAWTPVTLSFSLTALISGDPASPRDVVTRTRGIDPDSVTFYDDAVGHGDTYLADVVSPANDYPQDFDYANSPGASDPPLEEEFVLWFDVGDGAAGFGDGSGGNWHSPLANPTTQIFVSCDHTGSGGWCRDESMTKTWRVRGNPAWSAQAIAAMVGKTADWAIVLTGPDTDLPLAATPASGTLTFTTSGQITNGQAFSVDLEMPGSAIPTGAEALAWADGDRINYYGTPVGPKGCSTNVVLSNNSHDFCVDALGVYHDD